MIVSKKRYLQTFGVVVVVLALYRCACPEVAEPVTPTDAARDTAAVADTAPRDTITTRDIVGDMPAVGTSQTAAQPHSALSIKHSALEKPHPIYSVPRFDDTFPDSQNVQILAARQWGVPLVRDRQAAEGRKSGLVYAGASPYYYVDNLRLSIPYLVPRAATLLNDIGRAYYDSLFVKGIPLHKIIVTSVLRTQEDVDRLKRHNGNATDNSCHLYGTTFDVCYNRYKTVTPPDGPRRRAVRNDTLKWILAEVLRDVRESGRAYVKYEVKQGCFHITVR